MRPRFYRPPGHTQTAKFARRQEWRALDALRSEEEETMPRNANVNPVFRSILATMSGGGIGPTPPSRPAGEPTGREVPPGDPRTIIEVCEDIIALARRMKEDKP